jgi:hypothetical protein
MGGSGAEGGIVVEGLLKSLIDRRGNPLLALCESRRGYLSHLVSVISLQPALSRPLTLE